MEFSEAERIWDFDTILFTFPDVLSELLGSLKIIHLATPQYIENTEKYILLCRSTISKSIFNFLIIM